MRQSLPKFENVQALASEERRRSQRVMIRVPVTLHLSIAGEVLQIGAHTISVNNHGAMLICSRMLEAGTQLKLENKHTRQHVACRVTRAPGQAPEGFLTPVEFDVPASSFWQISFPPLDWKPREG